MVAKNVNVQIVLIKIVDAMDLENAFVSQKTHLVVAASKMQNKDWDPNLTPEQNYVLRQEGTESPGSSPLNNEKREGSYHCVGCGTKLFDSSTKSKCLSFSRRNMKLGPARSAINTNQLIMGNDLGRNSALLHKNITGKKMKTVTVTALVI